MKKLLCALLIVNCSLFAVSARAADGVNIAEDVSDPMYMERQKDLVFRLSADLGSDFQLRQAVSYGITNKFAAGADIRYRVGAKGDDDNGLSNVGLMGKYRAAASGSGSTDVLFGIGYSTLAVVPDYSNNVYSVGVRTGKQWNGMTLALTAMTNWIFSNEDGMAYIDLTPEAYFRVRGGWALGFGGTFRKATMPAYDQIWLNAKVGSVIGKTGWFVNMAYEVDSADFRIGGNVNLLF